MISLTEEEIGEIVQQWIDGKTKGVHASRVIAKAQLKKVMEWLLENGNQGFDNRDGDTWVLGGKLMQALLDEVKDE